jgi:hypothetical protein
VTRKLSFRNTYTDAIWSENALRPAERLVALAYAKYAGAKDYQTGEAYPDDVAWVDWRTLSTITGIRSRDTLSKTTKALCETGWMTQIEPARQHRTPRYKLHVPARPDVRFSVICNDETA